MHGFFGSKSISSQRKPRIYRRYWECSFDKLEQRGIPMQVRSEYAEVKAYAENLRDNIRNGIA